MIVSKVVLLFPFFFLVKEKKNTKKVRRLIPRDTLTVFLGLRCIVVASFYFFIILRTDRQSVSQDDCFFWFFLGGDLHTFRSLFHQRSYLSIHLIHLSLEIEQRIYIHHLKQPTGSFFKKKQTKTKQKK